MKMQRVLAIIAMVAVPSLVLWVIGVVTEEPLRPRLSSTEVALDSAEIWSDEIVDDVDVATDVGDEGPISDLGTVDPGDAADAFAGGDVSGEYPPGELPVEEFPPGEYPSASVGSDDSYGWPTDDASPHVQWDGEQPTVALPPSGAPTAPAPAAPTQSTAPTQTTPPSRSSRDVPPPAPNAAVSIDLTTRCGAIYVARPDADGWRNLTWTTGGQQHMNILGLGWNPARSIGVRVGSEAFWFSVSCGTVDRSQADTFVVGLCGAVAVTTGASASARSARWTQHRHLGATMNVGGGGWSNAASVEFASGSAGTPLGLRCGESQFVTLP